VCVGTWLTFATDANRFQEKTNLEISLATVNFNFLIPFWSSFIQSFGFVDASRPSLANVLSNGKSLALVVGGARESLDAHHGTCNILLEKRKGFVKLALQHGASIVPVLSFGENELYWQMENPPGSTLRNIQDRLLSLLKWATPIFNGIWF